MTCISLISDISLLYLSFSFAHVLCCVSLTPPLCLAHGSVTRPMKSGTLASSLHSSRMKGLKAEKEGKERENDMAVTAPASTPFSVSLRKALCLMSSRTSMWSELRPQRLGSSKRDDSPVWVRRK